jgi:Pentapeptide repeats (8 copies)
LREANLSGHNLNNVNFSGMDLSGANLNETSLIKTNFSHTNLSNCSIYGIAAWDIQLDEQTVQQNLTITPPGQPAITVDNLKIAQFIYLLLNNAEIREVIDTIARKTVLILGRFTPERKAIPDAIREELRTRGFLPILFDFDKPASRDITETISTLAHLARFVIANITDAKSIPQELMIIVPNLPSVPVQPLILNLQHEYGMFEHFTRYPWVLPVYRYTDQASLLRSLKKHVIEPAEQKAQELEKR